MQNGINVVSFKSQPAPVTQKEKKGNALSRFAVDLGIGGVAGGIIGYTARPWQQDGKLTDEFVGSVGSVVDNLMDNIKKQDPTQEKVCDLSKKIFKLDLKKGMSEEALIDVIEKNAEIFDMGNVEKSELRKKISEEIKKSGSMDDFIEFYTNEKNRIKEMVTNIFSDVKKGKLKSLPENADQASKDACKYLDDAIKGLKKSSAAKCAVIGAAAMAISGLITDLAIKKAIAKKEAKQQV